MPQSGLDALGRSALHHAARDNDVDALRVGLDAGLEVDLAERRAGYTPLHIAVQDGSIDAIRLLLDAGADVNRRTVERSLTPLHLAVLNARKSPDGAIVRLLLDRGADKSSTDSIHQTPVGIARSQFRFPPAVLDVLEE